MFASTKALGTTSKAFKLSPRAAAELADEQWPHLDANVQDLRADSITGQERDLRGLGSGREGRSPCLRPRTGEFCGNAETCRKGAKQVEAVSDKIDLTNDYTISLMLPTHRNSSNATIYQTPKNKLALGAERITETL